MRYPFDPARQRPGARVRRCGVRALSLLALLVAILPAPGFAPLAAGAASPPNGWVGTWTQLNPANSPPGCVWPAMAYDDATGQVIMFGGYDLGNGFVYNSTLAYTPEDPNLWSGGTISGPSARFGASMAYDPDLGGVVLFGGAYNGTLNDTWLFVGHQWTQLHPPTSPSPRTFASMAFDQATGQLVLFGGEASSGVFPQLGHSTTELGDTWTFDGTNWTQVNTPGPAGRALASMAYDQATGQLLLFGGAIVGSSGTFNGQTAYRWFAQQDTWSWTGYQWQQVSPATSPPARFAAAMDFDAATGQLTLFGGFSSEASNGDLGDTWVWDGSDWAQLNPLASPSARDGAGMAYDPVNGQMILFGGESGRGVLSDTWSFAPPKTGVAWSEASTSGPPARSDASMAFDAGTGQLLLFGGQETNGTVLDDTWAWNGTAWANADTSFSRPSARSGAGMAFDAASGQLILFGGKDAAGQALDDTWIWGGDGWNQLVTDTRPPARYDASMAYDPASGQLILFGGATGSGVLSDMWAWDGTSWQQLSPASSPVARSHGALAFFYPTDQLVLFGGQAADGSWLTGLQDWRPATGWVDAGSLNLESPAMAFDQAIGDLVMIGLIPANTPGQFQTVVATVDQQSQLTQLNLDPTPSPRFGESMAYDPATGQLVLFGGKDAAGTANAETWVLFPTEDYSLTVAPATGEYSGTTTLTATLAYGGARVPGQTIEFAFLTNLGFQCGQYQQPACPTTDSNGVATLPNVSLQAYNFHGVGTYPGCTFLGGIYAFYHTGTYTQTVGCGDLTITPEETYVMVTQASPSGPVYGQPITFTGTVFHSTGTTASPSGTITYSVCSRAGISCSQETGTTQVDSSGNFTFTTSVPLDGGNSWFPYVVFTPANANFASSSTIVPAFIPGTQTLSVDSSGVYINPATTTTTVSADHASVPVGQTVTLTATVAPAFGFTPVAGIAQPAGSVTFYDGAIDAAHQLGTATLSTDPTTGTTSASLGISTLAAGAHTILAAYTGGYDPNTGHGDGNYNQSVSASGVSLDITTTTTTTLASSLNPSMTGSPVSYTAAVSPIPDGGTVAFQDGGSTISGCGAVAVNSAGQATCTVTYTSTGSHTISASYGGTSLYLGSTASPLTQQVDTNLSGFPKTSSGAYNLSKANLAGAYLVDANLSAAVINSANLRGANLSGATLTVAYLAAANLSAATLTHANLSLADLSKANLSGANLAGANLTMANLSGVNLRGANLAGANLSGANLSGVNLTGATGLAQATLTGVVWDKTTCPDGTVSNKDGGTCLAHLNP